MKTGVSVLALLIFCLIQPGNFLLVKLNLSTEIVIHFTLSWNMLKSTIIKYHSSKDKKAETIPIG